MGKLTKHVSLLLPEELYQSLRDQAKEDCRTLPNYIRWILRQYLAARNTTPPQPPKGDAGSCARGREAAAVAGSGDCTRQGGGR